MAELMKRPGKRWGSRALQEQPEHPRKGNDPWPNLQGRDTARDMAKMNTKLTWANDYPSIIPPSGIHVCAPWVGKVGWGHEVLPPDSNFGGESDLRQL